MIKQLDEITRQKMEGEEETEKGKEIEHKEIKRTKDEIRNNRTEGESQT